MYNSTNDDLVFQVQLLENTYDRNKVTQTLRKGKSSKDDSFAYTGGKKPKTIFTKTTDKMINEYKEDYEKKNLNLNNLESLQDPNIVPIDGLELDRLRIQDEMGQLGDQLQDNITQYEKTKKQLTDINEQLKEPPTDDEMLVDPDTGDNKYTRRQDRLQQQKEDELKAIKQLEGDINTLYDNLHDLKGEYDRIELNINTRKNNNSKEMNDYRKRVMAAQSTYIREQTPGEPEDEYKESIISKFKPPSDESIKEAAIYKQIKLLKANFAKIFDMSNPRRIVIVEDVIQMLQDKYDNGIYDTNTKWPKISTKLLEIYGYDNSNVTGDSIEHILAQHIIASPTADNIRPTSDWYKDFEDKEYGRPQPPNIKTPSVSSLGSLLNRYPDTKKPAGTDETNDTKSVEKQPTLLPPPLSDQTMDLAKDIKQISAIEAKKEPEEKTTGRKYEQARYIAIKPPFYVLLIRYRGNIYIGVSMTGEIGTYTVKPYFSVLKGSLLKTEEEGRKLDKKKSVIRPFEQWTTNSMLPDVNQQAAFRDAYFERDGTAKKKNPARDEVLNIDDGAPDIQFNYNKEIVKWRSLHPHYALQGKEDTERRKDYIKSLSTPQVVGAGISIPKHDKIVNFGNVLLMYDRLLRHNMLSIKKKGGGNIENFKNVKVSDKFVDIITGVLNKQNINNIYNELNDKEQELYNILVQVSNVHRYANIPKPNIKFLKDRLKIVEGEIEAGNDNLIEELTDILHTMILVKLITKKEATQHLQQYMDMNQ